MGASFHALGCFPAASVHSALRSRPARNVLRRGLDQSWPSHFSERHWRAAGPLEPRAGAWKGPTHRSEERRVGKEGSTRWAAGPEKERRHGNETSKIGSET